MQEHADLSNVKSDAVSNKSERSERKVLRTSFVDVCVYMTCWVPLCIVGFVEVFGSSSPRWAHLFAYYLVSCSSLTNPFIYGIMNPQFQYTFKKMLRIGSNNVQPISSASRVKGNENETVYPIRQRAQDIDKREAEDASYAPMQPSSRKRGQS